MTTIFDRGLDKDVANYEPLSPLSFLKRSARVYPERVAITYRDCTVTYQQLLQRCEAFAGFLDKRGLVRGDVVSVMLPNIPEMLELSHSAISGGRVLHAINTRLDAAAIRFQLEHAESKVIVYDREFAPIVAQMLDDMARPPIALEVVDPHAPEAAGLGHPSYEDAIREGNGHGTLHGPVDEWDAMALSYTSGTTGNPKGVVTHHRGGYLNAMANSIAWSMRYHPTYIWVLPMFHCNGWCFPWTITLQAGTHVCLRKVDVQEIMNLADRHQATHFCAAPVVLSMLAAGASSGRRFDSRVEILTAGAAPAAQVIHDVENLNANVTQVYGLTETYASTVVSAWKADWDEKPQSDRYAMKARAGVQFPACESLDVVDSAMNSVPWDGETIGEVVVRGNTVMRGYLKNADATRQAFAEGWFHTGDLAIRDRDGYISIRDRSKDMINSGGEKMSSLEIEQVLYLHPAVLEAVVVAAPDPKWGEAPWAFVTLKPGQVATDEQLREHCLSQLARYKVPRRFVFSPIEHTATGKVQKFKLREQIRLLLASSADH